MRPAATAEAWQLMAPPEEPAFQGLALATCESQGQEALLVALKLREALETPGRTAALVTPDRQLARRVAAELARFALTVDDSAGVPLDQTPPGSLFLLVAHALLGDGGPVPLLSAFKHPLAQGGLPQGGLRRLARRLERLVLRGPRRGKGLDALRAALAERGGAGIQPLLDWLDAFKNAARPFLEAQGGDLADLVAAHIGLVKWLAADETGDPAELWAKETGEAARDFLARLMEAGNGEVAPAGNAYPAVLAVLMGGEAVRPRGRSHPRLMILGQLEARLVEADSVVVAGLNEGTWPRTAEPGPWLNRHLRKALGLPPVEFPDRHRRPRPPDGRHIRRGASHPKCQGQHRQPDRAVALAAAPGHGDPRPPPAPAPRARPLLARLDQGPGRAGGPHPPDRAAGPLPAGGGPAEGPLGHRDRDADARDPYSVYARRILNLRPLDPLDADPGVREHGQIIHDVLEKFVEAYPADLPPAPGDRLLEMGVEAFGRFADQPEMQALWWPRFRQIARWFLAEETARRTMVRRIAAESEGLLKLGPDGRYTIRARADRLELRKSGGLAIADYKTGTIPTAADIRAGLSPQLPLEAASRRDGGFAGLKVPSRPWSTGRSRRASSPAHQARRQAR
jgi:ATP-dependent helicase/nuclease subunit B